MSDTKSDSKPIVLPTDDGYKLRGWCWQHASNDQQQPVVTIHAATSVRCRYYSRFATYLHQHGFNVITFDYRGIGESRDGSLRKLNAGWLHWGALDVQAALQYAGHQFAGHPIVAVGHSIGGMLLGLAASNNKLTRVMTLGSQHAYWPDYQSNHRRMMWLKWHLFMPAVTRIVGYFPGKRLGWLEDTPAGVVRDWVSPHPAFLDNFADKRGSVNLTTEKRQELRERFHALKAPLLAISSTDDPFATELATQRFLSYFSGSDRHHLRLDANALGVSQIGHFGFFHNRFEPTLWPMALQWLRDGTIPASARSA
jgi:predicted alpha/beta hydrolase